MERLGRVRWPAWGLPDRTTMTTESKLTRLPDLTLPAAPEGTPISLRTHRRQGTVLLLLHSAGCQACLRYVDALAEVHEQLTDWDGRVVVVVPAVASDAAQVHADHATPFAVAADPEGACARRCRVDGGSVLIADQWGEVFFTHAGSPDAHDFPSPAEVVEWLRFMAIQCPECQGEAG